jgi:hypothetical protein
LRSAVVLYSRSSCFVHPTHTSRGHVDALEPKLHPGRVVTGLRQGMVEDRLLDLRRDPVGVWPLGAKQPVGVAFNR